MDNETTEKKRYWLKLDKDFLKSPHIKIIKDMENGKDYIIFYLSLMLESIETIGHLRFSDLVPYDEKMLSSLTDTNLDIVRSAIKIFTNLGLIQILDDGTIFMTQVAQMTGKESESAERVRRFRENKKQLTLHCNGDVTKSNDNKEEDKQSINNNKNKYKQNITEIVSYLNSILKTRYKDDTKETVTKIVNRLKDGFTVDDFKQVIDRKYLDWYADPTMAPYLRPETLFGNKFEGYLNEIIIKNSIEEAEGKKEERENLERIKRLEAKFGNDDK